jgi:NADP-dependent 3-hydroxy acid dehydrogenase YdfG
MKAHNHKHFAGQVVVVTGAASGIGRSLSKLFSAAGAHVALCDIDSEGLEESFFALSGEHYRSQVDVADRSQVEGFRDEVLATYGRVDLVINNAGVDVSQSIAEISEEDFRWLFDINFWGVVHGTRAFLPSMLESNSGTIVNVSSTFGYVAWPMHGAYVASKFAVRGFTETLRHELQDTQVRAIPVHPGGIATNIVNNSLFYQADDSTSSFEETKRDFERIAKTSPESAARCILNGVRKGKTRILIGKDAYLLESITRIFPANYWRIISRAASGFRRSAKS